MAHLKESLQLWNPQTTAGRPVRRICPSCSNLGDTNRLTTFYKYN